MAELHKHSTYLDVLRFAASRVNRKSKWKYIILGRPGPTGKTFLYNMLIRNGYDAVEISEDIFNLVDYKDNENHFEVNYRKKQVVIVMNEPVMDMIMEDLL